MIDATVQENVTPQNKGLAARFGMSVVTFCVLLSSPVFFMLSDQIRDFVGFFIGPSSAWGFQSGFGIAIHLVAGAVAVGTIVAAAIRRKRWAVLLACVALAYNIVALPYTYRLERDDAWGGMDAGLQMCLWLVLLPIIIVALHAVVRFCTRKMRVPQLSETKHGRFSEF